MVGHERSNDCVPLILRKAFIRVVDRLVETVTTERAFFFQPTQIFHSDRWVYSGSQHEYSPRLIKQTVVGYGNAEKHQVQEMVRLLLSLKSVPSPHDAADALAVAICHFHHAQFAQKIARAVQR